MIISSNAGRSNCRSVSTSKCSYLLMKEENRGKIRWFSGIDHCRFKKQFHPGDQLRLEVEITRVRGLIAKTNAVATVDGEIACEAEVTFALYNNKERGRG